ncbi:hypothetical protein DPX16_23450 [Anabarilius grahami]|uniref:Uncharacterized protein n=1 Tax=Anabarilius grahami TaxID=495550 RepID=A0A3N0YS22_ANAGA|nr:hypothetical protein DPX16_23450 [Anabarilius grahami]
MKMDAAKNIADELNRGRYTENVLKYNIRLDSLAAEKRVAGHANYWTFRGKQTHSANFGDGYIHKEDPDKEKVCPNNLFHWRQQDLFCFLWEGLREDILLELRLPPDNTSKIVQKEEKGTLSGALQQQYQVKRSIAAAVSN